MKAFDYTDDQPFDRRPMAAYYASQAERAEAIYDALSGVTLGDYDRQVIDRTSGLGNDTCRVLVGLFLRARRVGPYRFRSGHDTSADARASSSEIAAIKRREDV